MFLIIYSLYYKIRENDSIALINYAEALKLYRDMGNDRAMGSILFNIGSIHVKNKRFADAIISYQDSIACILNNGFFLLFLLSSQKRIEFGKGSNRKLQRLIVFEIIFKHSQCFL